MLRVTFDENGARKEEIVEVDAGDASLWFSDFGISAIEDENDDNAECFTEVRKPDGTYVTRRFEMKDGSLTRVSPEGGRLRCSS